VAALLGRPLLFQRQGGLGTHGGGEGPDEPFEVTEQPLLGRLELSDAGLEPPTREPRGRRLKLSLRLRELLVKAIELVEPSFKSGASRVSRAPNVTRDRLLRIPGAAQQADHHDSDDTHGPDSSMSASESVWYN